jgi:hypothetical protein
MPTEVPLTLTVYSRTYCHLCEEMIAALHSLQGRFHFQLRLVDVDADPALERLHGEKVPVLAHGDRELCHYRLDLAAVTAYLADFR